MKILKNHYKRRILKIKISLKQKYQKKLITKLQEERNFWQKEFNIIEKAFKDKLKFKSNYYIAEIENIRAQERKQYIVILNEREEEIKSLKQELQDKADRHKAIIEKERAFENIVTEIAEDFRRAENKTAEAIHLVQFAVAKAERYNDKQIKKNKNLVYKNT